MDVLVGVVHHHGVELGKAFGQEDAGSPLDTTSNAPLFSDRPHRVETADDRFGVVRHAAIDEHLCGLFARGGSRAGAAAVIFAAVSALSV